MINSILSVFCALLFLLSSLNLSILTHYCGGRAVKTEIALSNLFLGCGMEGDSSCEQTSMNKTDGITKKACCEDDQMTLSIVDVFKISKDITLKIGADQLLIQPIRYHFHEISNPLSCLKLERGPPHLKLNFQVLFQSFLL